MSEHEQARRDLSLECLQEAWSKLDELAKNKLSRGLTLPFALESSLRDCETLDSACRGKADAHAREFFVPVARDEV